MERAANEIIELGTVSGDTAGDDGFLIEGGGRQPRPGLEQD